MDVSRDVNDAHAEQAHLLAHFTDCGTRVAAGVYSSVSMNVSTAVERSAIFIIKVLEGRQIESYKTDLDGIHFSQCVR